MSDLTRVLTHLNSYDPTRIALLLKDLGIRGSKHDSMKCPLTNYIKKECGWAETVIVAPNFFSAYPSKDCYDDPGMPTAVISSGFENVKNFIAQFDQGLFPFLLTK